MNSLCLDCGNGVVVEIGTTSGDTPLNRAQAEKVLSILTLLLDLIEPKEAP